MFYTLHLPLYRRLDAVIDISNIRGILFQILANESEDLISTGQKMLLDKGTAARMTTTIGHFPETELTSGKFHVRPIFFVSFGFFIVLCQL